MNNAGEVQKIQKTRSLSGANDESLKKEFNLHNMGLFTRNWEISAVY